MTPRATSGFIVGTLLACVATASTRAGAQQVAYAATAGAALDSATQVAVAREMARAKMLGVPVEPLVAKVREGRLKRAPGSRIQAAVEHLVERMSAARAALGAESAAAEIIAGADAIAVGADGASLRALRAATTRSIAGPIGTLAQLLASGVEQRKAVEMIVALLRRNAAPAQVLALGNLVEADVASGLRADESATFRLRGIEGSLGVTGADAAAAAPGLGGVQSSRPPVTKRRP